MPAKKRSRSAGSASSQAKVSIEPCVTTPTKAPSLQGNEETGLTPLVHLPSSSSILTPSPAPKCTSSKRSAAPENTEQRPTSVAAVSATRSLAHEPLTTGDGGQKALPSKYSSSSKPSEVRELENVVLRSKVVAPDVSGIRCIAVSHCEKELTVARENGSLVLYRIEYFQNIPHFIQTRHTGGRMRRTITRLRYLDLGTTNASDGRPFSMTDRYILASYLSGQLVIYDSETLFPVTVHQRTGGALWDFWAGGPRVYTAQADGSWHQLIISVSKASQRPELQLQRIIPKVTGSDRALSVNCAPSLALAVGTDDAGNVNAWRFTPAEAVKDASVARKSLSDHESLWTSRLPKGMGLCCAIACGVRPAVAVGTSMGDMVLLDTLHGNIMYTFSQHKGPLSTVIFDNGVLYASGWHESLRSYRCDADHEWYPAEVKRRTHYHEASELAVLSEHQLLLSAARDGTIMYAPVPQLFTSPAMYVNVTTQQFAFAKEKNILLHTRMDRIEAFRTDISLRHWSPLFAHKLAAGKFHTNGMWCDAKLHYIVFSTDERVVVAKICWRPGAEEALIISRIEEVLELPVEMGVLGAILMNDLKGGSSLNEDSTTEIAVVEKDYGRLYLLLDSGVVFITLTEGYPVVRTSFPYTASSGSSREEILHLPGDSVTAVDDIVRLRGIRPVSLSYDASRSCLQVFGLRGMWSCQVTPDGTPDATTFTYSREIYGLVRSVPALQATGDSLAEAPVVVGLSVENGRYVEGAGTSTPTTLSRSVPHDTVFVAQLASSFMDATPGISFDAERSAASRKTKTDAPKENSRSKKHPRRYVGYFGRGLLFVQGRQWRMVDRASVEAAFVTGDNQHVLILERNLEKALESLPLCWKVRRFGN